MHARSKKKSPGKKRAKTAHKRPEKGLEQSGRPRGQEAKLQATAELDRRRAEDQREGHEESREAAESVREIREADREAAEHARMQKDAAELRRLLEQAQEEAAELRRLTDEVRHTLQDYERGLGDG
jgi:hypothetical protein